MTGTAYLLLALALVMLLIGVGNILLAASHTFDELIDLDKPHDTHHKAERRRSA